jgi:hypothetical protein
MIRKAGYFPDALDMSAYKYNEIFLAKEMKDQEKD